MKNQYLLRISIISLLLISLLSGIMSCSENGQEDQPAETGTEDNTTQIQDSSGLHYMIVDTGQTQCFDDRTAITCPASGGDYYGQDALYSINTPSYRDNGDGTVTDLNTGLMWQQDPGEKMTRAEALEKVDSLSIAGYSDWRIPTIKELYSLIDFSGTDPSGNENEDATPFIDTDYFYFEYGDTSVGDRIIDSQFLSITTYVSTTMNGEHTVFGVNFADGRIKGYPYESTPIDPDGKGFFVLFVRGNTDYGTNSFIDNNDGTVTDESTGLMWLQDDSGTGMNWKEALDWVQQKNEANYLGYNDWRLPNAKELESIVDYTRSPDTTNSAAIDPVFSCTRITNEAGQADYPFYLTSTTHIKNNGMGDSAVYVAFGRAMGYMNGAWIDVHGAGAQRSDPKTGDSDQYPTGHGPQGDAIRIDNYVRLVRDAS